MSAVIANVGVGHHHDLSMVGRIGEDFLVARHARVEAQLPAGFATGAYRKTIHHYTVRKGQLARFMLRSGQSTAKFVQKKDRPAKREGIL